LRRPGRGWPSNRILGGEKGLPEPAPGRRLPRPDGPAGAVRVGDTIGTGGRPARRPRSSQVGTVAVSTLSLVRGEFPGCISRLAWRGRGAPAKDEWPAKCGAPPPSRATASPPQPPPPPADYHRA